MPFVEVEWMSIADAVSLIWMTEWQFEAERRDAWERTFLVVYALTGESISYDDLTGGKAVSEMKKQEDWEAFNERAMSFFEQKAEA